MTSILTFAVFARDVDPLMIRTALKRHKVVFLVERQSAVYEWVSKIISPSDLLIYSVDESRIDASFSAFEQILYFSNIKDLLDEHGISHLVTTERISPLVNRWARESGLLFIGTDYATKLQFENKIWFDEFMLRNNIPKPDSVTATLGEYTYSGESKIVMQDPDSYGGEGTYFINSASDLAHLRKLKSKDLEKKFLFRNFIDGMSYGITIFISPSKIAVSPLRLQCFYPSESKTRPFAGIQWVDDLHLSPELRKNITTLFTSLGLRLHSEKFLGFANIDFIANANNEIFVIECNPRFSAATSHVIKFPELLGNLNSLDELMLSYSQSTPYSSQPHVMKHDSSFRGSYINIDIIPKNKEHMVIKRSYPYGLYSVDGSGISFISPDISQFKYSGREIVYFSDAEVGKVYHERTTASYIWSDFPLYDTTGNLSNEGNKLVTYFNQV